MIKSSIYHQSHVNENFNYFIYKKHYKYSWIEGKEEEYVGLNKDKILLKPLHHFYLNRQLKKEVFDSILNSKQDK